MRRRTFLASLGLSALAGCNGVGGESTPTSTTETPTRTVGATQTAEFPFEFVGVEAPEEVQLNVPFAFDVRVRNAGERERTFTSKLSIKVGDGEWQAVDGEITMTLPPGEEGVWQSPRAVPSYLNDYHYRLEAFGETWTTSVVPKHLDFGKRYATPTGLFVTVLGGRFESTYPTDEELQNETATPHPTPMAAPEGKTWLVLSLDVRNRTQEPLTTPAPDEFVVQVGGETYLPEHQDLTVDPYESMELDGRTVQRGELVYAVPEGTTAADLSVTFEKSLSNGDVKVVWDK